VGGTHVAGGPVDGRGPRGAGEANVAVGGPRMGGLTWLDITSYGGSYLVGHHMLWWTELIWLDIIDRMRALHSHYAI